MRNVLNCAILVVLSFCVFGCSAKVKTEHVEGTVTYKGAPLEGAHLSFLPMDSEGSLPASGITDAQGKYVTQTQAVGSGTTPGEYKVSISKTIEIPQPAGSEYTLPRSEEVLPTVYNNVSKTPLRATVRAGGPNVFDFNLVDKP